MRKRNHVIPVRLNAREVRELNEQVERSGLSREEFMRSLILGAQVHAKPCEHHPELLRKIAGLCNNANQLAHVANASGMASEQSIQEMLRLTKETWYSDLITTGALQQRCPASQPLLSRQESPLQSFDSVRGYPRLVDCLLDG